MKVFDSHIKIRSYLWIYTGFAIILWCILPAPIITPEFNLPSIKELESQVSSMIFTPSDIPKFSPKEKYLAHFGKKLFFDTKFSANNKVSCATCHIPEKSFTDALPLAQGIGTSTRRTPSIINSFASHWFFWDGRADSLESQALGPVEHPMEHGISRLHVARLLKENYRDEYQKSFGAWPTVLEENLLGEAMPQKEAVNTSTKISAYSFVSLNNFRLQDSFLTEAPRQGLSPQNLLARNSDLRPFSNQTWVDNWESFSQEKRDEINKVFSNFGKAIAAYERGIIAIESPFDKFAEKFLKTSDPARSFNDKFSEEELYGLKLFLGPGQCNTCHMGANFTDQQFHNIGLPLPEEITLAYIDVGRSFGVHLAAGTPFNCLGPYYIRENKSESCREIPWLDTENLELVGAFKTPSLRNVALRAPYGHDGRFSSLEEILDHYNDLPERAGIGHVEETLKPLGFKENDTKAVIAFLRSLSSPVRDLTLGLSEH